MDTMPSPLHVAFRTALLLTGDMRTAGAKIGTPMPLSAGPLNSLRRVENKPALAFMQRQLCRLARAKRERADLSLMSTTSVTSST